MRNFDNARKNTYVKKYDCITIRKQFSQSCIEIRCGNVEHYCNYLNIDSNKPPRAFSSKGGTQSLQDIVVGHGIEPYRADHGIISLKVIGQHMYAFIDRYLFDNVNSCLNLQSSAEKEEKAIAAIKKEPIQADQFLQKLRQKKLDKYLTFEVRVSGFKLLK